MLDAIDGLALDGMSRNATLPPFAPVPGTGRAAEPPPPSVPVGVLEAITSQGSPRLHRHRRHGRPFGAGFGQPYSPSLPGLRGAAGRGLRPGLAAAGPAGSASPAAWRTSGCSSCAYEAMSVGAAAGDVPAIATRAAAPTFSCSAGEVASACSVSRAARSRACRARSRGYGAPAASPPPARGRSAPAAGGRPARTPARPRIVGAGEPQEADLELPTAADGGQALASPA